MWMAGYWRQLVNQQMKIKGAKVISAEYSFDGARLTLTFSNESDNKVDLKNMRKDLQKRYSSAKVQSLN